MMPKYAYDYAVEMAWREDTRAKTEKERFNMIFVWALTAQLSR